MANICMKSEYAYYGIFIQVLGRGRNQCVVMSKSFRFLQNRAPNLSIYNICVTNNMSHFGNAMIDPIYIFF